MKPFVLLLAIHATFVNLVAIQDAKPCNPCDLRVAQSVAQKLQTSRVEPIYPPEVRAHRTSGSVRIGYVIGRQGTVVRTFCIQTEPTPKQKQVCAAAEEAVSHWKYSPYLIDGEPVEVETAILLTFDFSKSDSGGPVSNAQGKPLKFRIPPQIAEGLLIHRVEPTYPAEAKKNQIQGDVSLRVLIAYDGHVAVLEQVSGDPVLGRAAADAVEQWVYTPYMVNGDYADVETTVKLGFHL